MLYNTQTEQIETDLYPTLDERVKCLVYFFDSIIFLLATATLIAKQVNNRAYKIGILLIDYALKLV